MPYYNSEGGETNFLVFFIHFRLINMKIFDFLQLICYICTRNAYK